MGHGANQKIWVQWLIRSMMRTHHTLDDKNTLYFASNGEKSMGEFDIFSISKDENGMG